MKDTREGNSPVVPKSGDKGYLWKSKVRFNSRAFFMLPFYHSPL